MEFKVVEISEVKNKMLDGNMNNLNNMWHKSEYERNMVL